MLKGVIYICKGTKAGKRILQVVKSTKNTQELSAITEKVGGKVIDKAGRGINIIGKNFGKLGTVVKKPNIGIKLLDKGAHYLNSKINRLVSSTDVINTVKKPLVVLKQANGRFLYLSEKAAVVINQEGKLITAYGRSNFDSKILNVLKAAVY